MAVLSKNELKTNIQTELADNNAGAISAYDVRHNMEDIVDSINWIVASGDFEATHPFFGNVKAVITNNMGGAFIPQSGIVFPYGGRQLEAYPGAGSIDHNNLDNLTDGDVHTQYVNVNGARTMAGNFGLDDNWINSSGNAGLTSSNDRGLKFEYVDSNKEIIHIGNKSHIMFDGDSSTISTSKGVAKAWINFDATSATPTINSYYNIYQLEKLDSGKFEITFPSGTFGDNYYIAIGSSNARSTAASEEDFSMNKVGIVLRSGDDAASLRSLTFAVFDEGGQFVDAKINELIVYGRGPGEGSGVHPIVIASS